MPTNEMIIQEIREALPKAIWTREKIDEGKEHDAIFFRGSLEGITFVVVSFDIEEQGFPKGTRGHDGACTLAKHALVYRLPRDLAKEVFDVAVSYHE